MARLSGKVAIVTGGANERGFGSAIARILASEGAKVLIGDLDLEGAEKIAASINPNNVRAISMNVCQAEDWKQAVKFAIESFGRLDIVVNNAGATYHNKSTLDVTEDEFDRVFNVNVKSLFWSSRICIPQMQEQGAGGSIINIASIGGIRPRGGLVWYSSSKAAVINASKALASEFGKDQIRVNSICPLLSGTMLFEQFVGVPDTPEARKNYAKEIPLGRLAEPADVAGAALFLASDESRFVTGVNLEVDGGRAI